MRNKLSKIFGSGIAFSTLATSAFAQTDDDPAGWLGFFPGLVPESTTLSGILIAVINWLIGGAVIVCVVMLVWAGYSYMTAGGDEGKVTKATKTLTNAIIGLVIALVALVLVNFVKTVFLKLGAAA